MQRLPVDLQIAQLRIVARHHAHCQPRIQVIWITNVPWELQLPYNGISSNLSWVIVCVHQIPADRHIGLRTISQPNLHLSRPIQFRKLCTFGNLNWHEGYYFRYVRVRCSGGLLRTVAFRSILVNCLYCKPVQLACCQVFHSIICSGNKLVLVDKLPLIGLNRSGCSLVVIEPIADSRVNCFPCQLYFILAGIGGNPIWSSNRQPRSKGIEPIIIRTDIDRAIRADHRG
ncbi:hypothetical protein D3C77_309540 [compost metagenome]